MEEAKQKISSGIDHWEMTQSNNFANIICQLVGDKDMNKGD